MSQKQTLNEERFGGITLQRVNRSTGSQISDRSMRNLFDGGEALRKRKKGQYVMALAYTRR